MKKITLKNLNLKEVEQLSREQLKNVLGGYEGVTTVISDRCLDGPECSIEVTGKGEQKGKCEENSNKKCVCNTGSASALHEPCVRVVS